MGTSPNFYLHNTKKAKSTKPWKNIKNERENQNRKQRVLNADSQIYDYHGSW